MLKIKLPATDESEALVLRFEHSLASLSKWESIHEKPFFGKTAKGMQMTPEELLSYIEQMLLDEISPEDFQDRLKEEHFDALLTYINSKQTATWFADTPQGKQKTTSEIYTAELIYYWMIQFKIPFEAQHWHLNKLMTLIRISGIKQTKPKKMSRAEQAQQMRELNAKRRAELGTTG